MRKHVEESVATGAAAGRGRGGRFSAGRKREVVMRLLRGEDLESVSRAVGITAARASHWRAQFLGRADSLDPQLRPGFPVPFAMKRRRLEHAANMADQDVVRGGADRPAPARGRRRLPPRIHAGAGAVPHAADPLHAVRPTRGDRVGALHRLDLRRAKGPAASNWSTFA